MCIRDRPSCFQPITTYRSAAMFQFAGICYFSILLSWISWIHVTIWFPPTILSLQSSCSDLLWPCSCRRGAVAWFIFSYSDCIEAIMLSFRDLIQAVQWPTHDTALKLRLYSHDTVWIRLLSDHNMALMQYNLLAPIWLLDLFTVNWHALYINTNYETYSDVRFRI